MYLFHAKVRPRRPRKRDNTVFISDRCIRSVVQLRLLLLGPLGEYSLSEPSGI